ncbi:MAG: hypothetical protein WAN44_12150 [Propionibacteriaceae bacterium]
MNSWITTGRKYLEMDTSWARWLAILIAATSVFVFFTLIPFQPW